MRSIKLFALYFVIVTLFLMTGWAYAATFVVDSLGDVDDSNPYTASDGTNTLRKCIRLANDNVGADTINFGVSGTISPASRLPAITDSETVIDASSQWVGIWPAGQPGITLDGSGAGDYAYGLHITGADNCHIRGLFITKFDGYGVQIGDGSQFNTVGGAGTGYRSIISGNGFGGVLIGGSGTDDNVVSGNYIGTGVNGTADMENRVGVFIWDGAQSNIIGGATEGERNIISGNNVFGVQISNSGTDNNVVSGNYIGTDINGTADLGNGDSGISISDGAQSSTIGGAIEGERNIISGNNSFGVFIGGSGTDNNVISGNYIGTDANGAAGVSIWDGAQSNTIGGVTEGERNIISGNDSAGVWISGSGTNSNVVSGNCIGTDVNGTAVLGNTFAGVSISSGAQSNTIGGDTAGNTVCSFK